jgi:hypothetical protein
MCALCPFIPPEMVIMRKWGRLKENGLDHDL